MALRTQVLPENAIEIGGSGGDGKTTVVNDTSDAAIAKSTNGLGRQVTWREIRYGQGWRWKGLTKDAAVTFWAEHLNDSTDTFQVRCTYNCDNEILGSYTVEWAYEYTMVFKVSEKDIPDAAADGGTAPVFNPDP